MEDREETTKFFDEDFIPEAGKVESAPDIVSPITNKRGKSILSDKKKLSPEEQRDQVQKTSSEMGRITKLEHESKDLRKDLNDISKSISKMMMVIVALSLLVLGAKISHLDIGLMLGGEVLAFSGSIIEIIIQGIVSFFGLKTLYIYTKGYDEDEVTGKKKIKPDAIVKEIQDNFDSLTDFKQTIKR